MNVANSTGIARQSRLRGAVTDTIIDAVIAELAEVGFGRLSMEAVARRAGSSKPSLYRRWDSREAMVISALRTIIVNPVPDVAPTGDLLSDVRRTVEATSTWMQHPVIRQVLPDLIAEGGRNSLFSQLMAEQLSRPRRRQARTALGDTVEYDDADLDFALDLIAAPIYWRLCVQGGSVGADYLDAIAEVVHGRITRNSPVGTGRLHP